jgi:hypothetical protein
LTRSRGFIKDGNKNRLREQDIHRIVDTFRKQADVPRYARMVSDSRRTDRAVRFGGERAAGHERRLRRDPLLHADLRRRVAGVVRDHQRLRNDWRVMD